MFENGNAKHELVTAAFVSSSAKPAPRTAAFANGDAKLAPKSAAFVSSDVKSEQKLFAADLGNAKLYKNLATTPSVFLTAKQRHTVYEFASEFAKKLKFLAAILADATTAVAMLAAVVVDSDLVFVVCSTA